MHARPEAGIARSAGVTDAMKNIDRKFYVPHGTRPYEDAPQGIGHNVTISAPHMHAMCLEALSAQLKPGARALDVGSGTGYLTVHTVYVKKGRPDTHTVSLPTSDLCVHAFLLQMHFCMQHAGADTHWACRWRWRSWLVRQGKQWA